MSSNQAPQIKDDMVATEQPFVAHLIELRDRLMRAIIAIGVVALALAIWPGARELYDWLAKPMMESLPYGAKMQSYEITAPFFVPMKVLLMTALVVVLPYVLYQAWAFIAPGLYRKEKLLVFPLVVSSTLLFFIGMAFCYFFVFNKVFSFIIHFSPESIQVIPDISSYLSFVLTMFLAFGVSFEVPVVVVVLVRMGLVTIEKLKSIRGYVVVGAFVIAAVVTPPDVISQLALAIPMCILYELGIIVSKLITPKTEDAEEATPSS
ncbi:MAG: twin-arginine translocase subunit TatC [Saezia sp.]